jgi:hypothetical protein
VRNDSPALRSREACLESGRRQMRDRVTGATEGVGVAMRRRCRAGDANREKHTDGRHAAMGKRER